MILVVWSLIAVAAPPRVAVTDLANRTGDPAYDAAGPGVSAVLVGKLARIDGLEVVERERLEEVLHEVALGKDGVVDPATAAAAGKVLGAQYLVAGEIVSVKLPTIGLVLRVVDTSTAQVVASAEVVGDVGPRGEDFFVLIDDSAARIVEALHIALEPRDRIELSQIDVRELHTVEVFGAALKALDSGDADGAQKLLSEALALEPGFRIAEATLDRLATEVDTRKAAYAHEAIKRAHAGWDRVEQAVSGPAANPQPTLHDIGAMAVRARVHLLRGELPEYLALEEKRVALELANWSALVGKNEYPENAFGDACETFTVLTNNEHDRSYAFGNLEFWPMEIRPQMAKVLALLGQKDEAAALMIRNYQDPGPLHYAHTLPPNPIDFADRWGMSDLVVVLSRQLLRKAELEGQDEPIKRRLDDLDEAIEDAKKLHEERRAYDEVMARIAREPVSEDLLWDEERALSAVEDDPTLALAGYRAFHQRVKAGYYDTVRTTSEFDDVAEEWYHRAEQVWGDFWFVDQRLSLLLEFQEHVPSRDAEDEERRKQRVQDWIAGAYD